MNKHISLILNDNEYADFLNQLLTEKGYKSTVVDDEIKFLNNVQDIKVDLVICSYELTNIDGESMFTRTREVFPDLPFIFLSSTKDEDEITNMLQYDACEFMVKPIVPAELLSRIKVYITPNKEVCENGSEIVVGDLTLDLNLKKAKRKNREIILTPTEYNLLEYLMSNSNTVLSRNAILNKIWSTTENVSDRIVDVYISYLREKIDTGNKKKLIETVKGFGYRIRNE